MSTVDGGLMLYLYDFSRPQAHFRLDALPVPIGRWFHIEVYLRRASDDRGAIALYQDGEPLVELTDLPTADSEWAQWYVGNLADALQPSRYTLYVDDVSITPQR